jgi:hypothetical protein
VTELLRAIREGEHEAQSDLTNTLTIDVKKMRPWRM